MMKRRQFRGNHNVFNSSFVAASFKYLDTCYGAVFCQKVGDSALIPVTGGGSIQMAVSSCVDQRDMRIVLLGNRV